MKEIKRGEIYYADLSPVVGSEQGGVRPVLILQSEYRSRCCPTTIVAAITSKITKPEMKTHVHIEGAGLQRQSIVLLEQIRTIDKSRLEERVGRLDKNTMGKVDHAIITGLGIKMMEVIL